MTTNNTNEDIMAKNNKTSNATSDTSQDNLNKLFGDSVIVSSEPTTSKAKTSNEPLEMARQEIKLASQKIMAKYGVRCSFVTTIRLPASGWFFGYFGKLSKYSIKAC